MTRTHPRPIASLLHTANATNAELGAIVRHARTLHRVRQVVVSALPREAVDHVHVAAADSQRLLLHVDNAGWATRLRYSEPTIRRALAQRLRMHVAGIKVRVRPALAPARTQAVVRRISPGNRACIRQVAGHIDDRVLSQALRRLANANA